MILQTTRALAASVLRALMILLLIVLVGAALYVSLGRQLAPRVADYKDWLEQRLSVELGMPVSIGSLSGEWLQFTPRFNLENLSLGDTSSLQLQHVSIAPALLESLQQRRLVIANTSIDALDISFRQAADGRWQLEGLTGSGSAADPQMIFQLLTRLARLSLEDTRLHFIDRNGDEAHFDQAWLNLQSQANSLLVQMQARLQGSPELLRLDAELEGASLAELAGQVYISLPRADYHVFMPEVSASTETSAELSTLLDFPSAILQGELWTGFEQGRLHDMVFSGQGELTLMSAVNQSSGELHQLENMRVEGLYLSHEQERDLWHVYANDVSFDLDGQPWPEGDLSVSYQPGLAAELHADVIDLGIVSRFLAVLPIDERLRNEVVGFNPRGRLQHLKMNASFSDGALAGIHIASNVQEGAITAHRGAPSFWGVDGYAEFDFDPDTVYGEGFIEVDSSTLSMHIPNLFNDVWNYDHVNGRVGFRFNAADTRNINVRMASGVIVAKSDIVTARGQFATEIQTGNDEDRFIELELKLGALEADVSRKSQYLPTAPGAPRMAQGILDWVGDAVVGGSGAGSGLIFRGYVHGGSASEERTLQMFYRVTDGTLKFDPAWPALEELDGFVLIDDGEVDISAEAGSTLGINFNSSVASVRQNPAGGNWLTVSGLGRGSAAQGLQYLQQTPVTGSIARHFSDWTAEGDTDIELALSIPLGVESARPTVSLSFAFENNRLFIPEYELQLDALAGSIYYTDEGLRSEGLTAQVFGEEISGSIVADIEDSSAVAGRQTRLQWSGSTHPETLIGWSGMPAVVKPLLSRLDGEFAYQAELLVPVAGTGAGPDGADGVGTQTLFPQLHLRSDLSGATVNLPEPLYKESEQGRLMDMTLEFRPQGPVVDLRWQDVLQMNLVVANGQPQSGLVFFGATTEGLRVRRLNPSAPGVEVLGSFHRIDYSEWQRTFAEMMTSSATVGAAATGSMTWLNSLRGSAELSVAELAVAGESFNELNLSLRRLPDAWELGLLGEDISGTALYPLTQGEPWQLNLEYLHLGEAPPEIADEEVPGGTVAVDLVEPDAAEIAVEQTANSELDLEDLPIVEYELPREDPLASLDPRTFPSIQVNLGQLTLSGADFGSWKFELDSDDSGAVFHDLQIVARGLHIGSDTAPAEFRWIYDGDQHRSVLNAQVTATDLAPVLSAYGYAPSLQSSTANFDTRVHWDGSPAYFSALGLSGDIGIKINNGRFQQRAGVANSALRLISIINFDAVIRRLRFSDDFLRSGLSYDEISGRVSLGNGIVNIVDRLQIIGPASLFQLAGELDLAEQTIDADLYITLPVSDNIPWLGGLAVLNNLINWQLAIGVFLFDRIFGDQVESLTSAQYTLEGPWDSVEPRLYQVFASGSQGGS